MKTKSDGTKLRIEGGRPKTTTDGRNRLTDLSPDLEQNTVLGILRLNGMDTGCRGHPCRPARSGPIPPGLTCRAVRVIWPKIRVGKPVRDRRCPATVRRERISPSQATARIHGAAITFAGEGGFRSRTTFSDPVAANYRGRAPSLLASSIGEVSARRRWIVWKTHKTNRHLLTPRDCDQVRRAAHTLARSPFRSPLTPVRSPRSSISPRRPRCLVRFMCTWSQWATDGATVHRVTRHIPAMARRPRSRFARTPDQC